MPHLTRKTSHITHHTSHIISRLLPSALILTSPRPSTCRAPKLVKAPSTRLSPPTACGTGDRLLLRAARFGSLFTPRRLQVRLQQRRNRRESQGQHGVFTSLSLFCISHSMPWDPPSPPSPLRVLLDAVYFSGFVRKDVQPLGIHNFHW